MPQNQVGTSTRDRILDAAVLRFCRHSYNSVSLRNIAADVDVDVAYVHRCFGSKERLFAQAVRAMVQGDRLLADVERSPGAALAKQFFAREKETVGPLDILIHSLSSAEASDVLREVIISDFIDPLARRLHQSSTRQAALIAAFLLGAGILRSVLRIDDLLEPEGAELEREIAHTIKVMARDTAYRAPIASLQGRDQK